MESLQTVQDSAYSVAQYIEAFGFNMVRFPASYKAEQSGEASMRKALGESGRGQGSGVGHALHLSKKITGTSYNSKGNKLTVILTIKDKTHRQNAKSGGFVDADKRAFEFATRTVADGSDPSRNLPWIEVCKHGKTWERISLKGLPTFPSLPNDVTPESFSVELLALLSLGAKIKKLDGKVDWAKKKVGKGSFEGFGLIADYHAPEGQTTKIVQANGEDLETVKREITNRYSLVAELDAYPRQLNVAQTNSMLLPEYLQKQVGDCEDVTKLLPVWMKALEVWKAEYVSRYNTIRPFEARFIEDALKEDQEHVNIGGTIFEVRQGKGDYEYDKPSDIAEGLESGKYKEIMLPSNRGSWELIEIPIEETQEA